MITAIVRFKIPAEMPLEKAKALFEETSPKYVGLSGLVRKYYLFSGDGVAGGVYLWRNRAAADGLYTEAWKQTLAERYGAPPDIQFYQTPVIVDNDTSKVFVAAAE